jgi:hypothetical protein
MNRTSGILAGAALALLVSCGTGQANVTLGGLDWTFNGVNTLTLTDAIPTGNQVKNLPCVICGENQPQQPAGFGYNDFGKTGNVSNLLFFSSGIVDDKTLGSDTLGATNYSGAFLAAFLEATGDVSLTFSIGIDVNDAAGQPRQTLESFFFLDVTTQTVLAAFINSTTGNLVPVNQGTGYPDMTLGSFSLAGLDLTHEYAFFARISGATDGPDSFFLVATPSVDQTPLPAAVWLFGSAVAGGAFMLRRRKNKVTTPAVA